MSAPSPLATPMPWDLVSDVYAAEVVPMFEHYADDALRLAAPAAGTRIVDVACGPGTLALRAASRGHAVDALDFSPRMIAQLEARRAAAGAAGVTTCCGDGQALPFDDGAYAAGFSMFGLMFFPDRARGFAELRRVLAPGARAVVSSWPRLEDNPVFAATFGALRAALAKMIPDGPPPGGAEMPLCTEELCRTEMSAAFADVVVHRIVHTQRFASADEAWAFMGRTMAPMVLLRRRLGEDAWEQVSESVRAAIRGVLGDRPAEIEMPAWLSVGVAR